MEFLSNLCHSLREIKGLRLIFPASPLLRLLRSNMEPWVFLAVLFAASLFYLFFRRPRPILVSEIIVYPIKSCGGMSVPHWKVTSTGLFLDRYWAVLNRDGGIVTAREDPRLWKLTPNVADEDPPKELRMEYEGRSFRLDLQRPAGEKVTVSVWEESAEVLDEGVEVANWLQSAFSRDYRLFRLSSPRPHTDPEVSAPTNTTVSLADMMQFLIVSEASLQRLVAFTPLPKKSQLRFSCFRPNIVMRGAEPFAEDTWKEAKIGAVELLGVAPCSRCSMTTIDPETLLLDAKTEPLPTLRKIHGKGVKAFFGQWFVRKNDGRIHVGDQLVVRSYKKFTD